MPTTLRSGPYRFYFWSQDCLEPRHMHVDRGRLSAKFWLDPDVRLVVNRGFPRDELRRVERLVQANLGVLRDEWSRFGSDNSADSSG